MRAYLCASILLALVSRASCRLKDDYIDVDAGTTGELTREQTEAIMAQLFKIIDVNKDGTVDSSELEKFNKSNLQKIQNLQLEQELQMMDTNKDGFVDIQELHRSFPPDSGSPEDFQQGLERRFSIADKNKDGKLDRSEMSVLLYPVKEEAMLQLEVKEIMQTHDKNGDGLISIAEYTSSKPEEEETEEYLESEFKPFDTNNDGYLSAEELIQAFKEEAHDELETNIEDVYAIIGDSGADYATWMKHAVELSTSSITDHGELMRFPQDYGVDIDVELRSRKSGDYMSDDVGDEL